MFRLYFVLVAALLLATNLVSTNASKENADERTSFNSIASFIRGNQGLANRELNPKAYDCTGKPDGNYPDYDPCSGYFYMCTNGFDKYFACALQGTVFDPTLDRCEYCQLVSPCNNDPNNIRCPDGGVGPSCPSTIPPGFICVCGATTCELQLVTTTVARPTCPPYDPNVYICVCGSTSCNLELIRPTCPPYDPSVYICICGATSCQLQLIPTTTARPTCPPYDPSVYICVCGATSCNLELIRPTCPPYDPNVYVCICGVSSCSLQLISTTPRPTGGVTAACPGRTVGTTPGNYLYDCRGKPDGNYEDPFDFCSGGFYMCTNQEAKYFICALQNTVFDPRQDRCDYCYNVPPCNSFPNSE